MAGARPSLRPLNEPFLSGNFCVGANPFWSPFPATGFDGPAACSPFAVDTEPMAAGHLPFQSSFCAGWESDADERFVRRSAAKLGLCFIRGAAHAATFAQREKVSLEMARANYAINFCPHGPAVEDRHCRASPPCG